MTYKYSDVAFRMHAEHVTFGSFAEAIEVFGNWPARNSSKYDGDIRLTDGWRMNSTEFRRTIENCEELHQVYIKCIPHTNCAADCIELAKEAWGKRLYYGYEIQPAIVHAMRQFRDSVPCLADLYQYAKDHLHDQTITDWAVKRTIRAFWISMERVQTTRACFDVLFPFNVLNGTVRELNNRFDDKVPTGFLPQTIFVREMFMRAYTLAGDDRDSLYTFIRAASREDVRWIEELCFAATDRYRRLHQGEVFDLVVRTAK